jgi:hypothetical protein
MNRDMKPSELLRKAAELIADPDRWTTGYYAVDANGDMVSPNNKKACKWCASGAMFKTMTDEGVEDCFPINLGMLASINDKERHAYTVGWMMHKADELDNLV